MATAILSMWPLRDHPDAGGEGARQPSPNAGRWRSSSGISSARLRPVVFLMGGMAAMPFCASLFWNVVGCVAWAFIVPKFGEVGGDLIGWIWSLF